MILFDKRNSLSSCDDALVALSKNSSGKMGFVMASRQNATRFLVFIFLLTIVLSSSAQQLVLLKKNKVRGRFNAGDEIRYSLFAKGQLHAGVIKSITDTSFVTPTDTIMLNEVRRVDGRTTYDFTRSLGIKMMTAGIILQLGDYVNVTLVQNQSYSFNPAVTITSAGMIVTGFLLHRIRKPFITLSHRAALVSVGKDSSLYR
jgi:hypothetical protein